jgi:hypothetical protein
MDMSAPGMAEDHPLIPRHPKLATEVSMEHKCIAESSAPSGGFNPFEGGRWFPMPIEVVDVMMPRLSPTAMLVLLVVVRQTWGWVARPGGNPRERRKWDRISYSQFQANSGIGSRATISRALSECMEKGFLLRRQVGTERGQPVYVYRLNLEPALEMERMDSVAAGYPQVRPLAGTENEPVTTTDSRNGPTTGSAPEPGIGSEGELTKQRRKQTEKNVAVGQPVDNWDEEEEDKDEQRSRALHLLLDAGVSDSQAWKLSRTCSLALVREWIKYTEKKRPHLFNPPGFLINGLRSGKAPPRERSRNAAYWEHDREELERRYAPYPQILR